MAKDGLFCFLPCRAGSERVKRKNIKPFANSENGLIEIKLAQLIQSELIEEIVLSTNDNDIIRYAESLHCKKVRIHKRSDDLSSSETSTDDLVAHARSLIPDGHILWTHVTSPFITHDIYNELIRNYRAKLAKGYDSLMTTTPIHGFLWNDDGPINYDRSIEKWPRTQTLQGINEVNSAAFIAPVSVYDTNKDRIGQRPFLHSLDKITSMDIDWPEDFVIAEQIALNGIREI